MTLTAHDIILVDGLIAKCLKSAIIAERLGLDAAEIDAYRTERKRLAQIARVQEARREQPEGDPLLTALLAHMPPPDQVPGSLGVPVWIGRAA
ncbi:MAG: hypothetical protein U1E60_32090 [Reyranellaceae bacterium]